MSDDEISLFSISHPQGPRRVDRLTLRMASLSVDGYGDMAASKAIPSFRRRWKRQCDRDRAERLRRMWR